MKTHRLMLTSLAALFALGLAATGALRKAVDRPQAREAARKLLADGNFNDAYNAFRELALDPEDEPREAGNDLQQAIQCLQQLGRVVEVDAFREQAVRVHAQNWRLLWAAAESYMYVDRQGAIVAGKFERGGHRGGGAWVNAVARDRAQAVQLMAQALPLAAKDEDRAAAADFYLALGRILLNNAGYAEAWRLQLLTSLEELPDYDQGWYYGGYNIGAPVQADGRPVYYHVPKTFGDSANDGERWRWALSQAAEMSPAKLNTVRWELAQFCQSQFGEATIAEYGHFFARFDAGGEAGENKSGGAGTYALHTLTDDETIARLATGIQRFSLPDEFNYIEIFLQIAADPATGYGAESLEALARVFENRRQYPRAAEHWRRVIREYGPGNGNYRELALKQIVDPWGRFENTAMHPAGQGASVEYRFRNGKEVQFEARRIEIDKLLADVKAYIKSKPNQLDWQKFNIGDLGYRLVQANETQYLADEPAAQWKLGVEPRPGHVDARVTVATPLQQAGAYLVKATMEGGNTSQIVLWLADTVLLKKPVVGGAYYFAADAITGKPVAKANLEFFGFQQRFVPQANRHVIDTANFAEFTDADGQYTQKFEPQREHFQWLATARTRQGRLAFLGFANVWNSPSPDEQFGGAKPFVITDRPVYRPNQKVKFKFWVREAKYAEEDAPSPFANQAFNVEIHDPKGDKVFEKQFTSDNYGGFDGEFDLPKEATLGVYQAFLVNGPVGGGGYFRVEEYKKPEFEVEVVAPAEPVMLGEKIAATIEAKYYFGSPVTKARVKYKVLRSSYAQSWYPIAPWDWFYGAGYWWFGYDSDWYPGFREWGCRRPIPWWYGDRGAPPEIVSQAEVDIGADGTAPVEIDTALAKEIHGDQDHRYRIVAEVVDESRRTIVGEGEVKVARAPFKTFVWVDRGHYRVGDTVSASIDAHTLNLQPVQGKGVLKLLRIAYDDQRNPVETPVEEIALDTNELGQASHKFKASAAGQYRLAYTLADAAGHAIEGGCLFTVMGAGVDSAQFRYNSLEIVPDKQDYRPGDKLRLQISTDRVGCTVLLFVRAANGVYPAPKVVRMKGKSTVEEISIVKRDMPNIFIEAVCAFDGKVFTETREIAVPPEKRVLNVKVEPSAETYKPGQHAEMKVTVTDYFGKPFVGSTVLTVYDKSIEYVSGGSNVPEIKEFFWKWRRGHYPRTESSLDRYFYNLIRPNDVPMNDLGIFGGSIVEEFDDLQSKSESRLSGRANRARGTAFGGGGPGAPEAAMEGGAMDAAKAMPANALADAGGEAEAAGAPLVQPTVRTKFADAALWVAAISTDGDGVATVPLDMPENLTAWKVRVWSLGEGTRVGQGDAEVVTRKDLIVRLQAPRFFVERDEIVLSANVHNYLKTDKPAQVSLELEGDALAGGDDLTRTVTVPADGEIRVDWRVKAMREGEAVVRMKALTDEESDAMEMRFPVYVHGMLKLEAVAGALRPEDNAGQFELRVPAERREEQTRLEVRFSPTLAGAMVDALPYLVEYPYGCTEQTLNRFLPTVIAQKILLDMQLDLQAIRDKRANLNPQELGEAGRRAAGWKRYDRNPVFDEEEVRRMVKEGVQRLTDMQVGDGGWGWFSGYGERSYAHTTAVVVHGLQIARQNDVAIVPGVVERGVAWLKGYREEQLRLLANAPSKTLPYKTTADNLDAFVYMALVDAGETSDAMRDYLYRDRTHLAVYAKALYGLALEKQGERDKLAMILRNIGQFVVQDDENQTAYLKLPEDNYWWHWYGSEIEADAYYLKLLARTDPRGQLASRLVKYLLNNRKHATYWNSTRDTATAIEALADFLKASGEGRPDLTVEVWLDGQKRKEEKITAENLFTFDNALVVEGADLAAGEHVVELRKTGQGPLYYNGYLTNFTLEDHIAKAGLEVKVNRKVYKLVPIDKTEAARGSRGQAVQQKVEKFRREELPNLGVLKSGDLVEVELEIDSKNDYEYLIFEDMKAAGFEPVSIQSGYAGGGLGAYMELRDERVCFFLRTLARGKNSLAYRLRAETPGKFSALPARASAMYAPELKANSDEIKLQIED